MICVFRIYDSHLVCLYFVLILTVFKNISLMACISSLLCDLPHPLHHFHSFGYFLLFLLCISPFNYIFTCSFLLLVFSFNSSFPCPSLTMFCPFSYTPVPFYIHASSLIQLGEEKCTTSLPACQPRTSIVPCRGQDKDYFIC